MALLKDKMKTFLLTSDAVLDYDFKQVILTILNLHMCSFNGCF